MLNKALRISLAALALLAALLSPLASTALADCNSTSSGTTCPR